MRKRDRLHVLMLLDAVAYPSPTGGGLETQVRVLSNALRASGHRVTVVVPMTRFSPQAAISRVDGVPVCRLRYPRVRLLGGPLLWLRLLGLLLSRRHRYDAWHAHVAHHFGAIAALAARMLGVRLIVKVSGIWELRYGALAERTASPFARLTLRGLRLAGAWQAISHRIAQRLAALGVPESRIVEIPNAVDTARFRAVVPDAGDEARFMFIGRLAPEKGLDTLLHAFADMSDEHPGARLILVGAGDLRPALQRIADTRGVRERVVFAGYRRDVGAALAEANVGVLTSRDEGLSNTLLETMASGLPLVASRISGNEDFVVHGENGWLFEVDDRAALAQCLREAASITAARRREMGECARATVERKASIERVLGRLVAAYRGGRDVAQGTGLSERFS